MHQHPRVRQGVPLAGRARREQELPRARGHAHGQGADVVGDQPHGVVDGEHRRDRAAGRVDPEADVGARVLGGQEQQLVQRRLPMRSSSSSPSTMIRWCISRRTSSSSMRSEVVWVVMPPAWRAAARDHRAFCCRWIRWQQTAGLPDRPCVHATRPAPRGPVTSHTVRGHVDSLGDPGRTRPRPPRTTQCRMDREVVPRRVCLRPRRCRARVASPRWPTGRAPPRSPRPSAAASGTCRLHPADGDGRAHRLRRRHVPAGRAAHRAARRRAPRRPRSAVGFVALLSMPVSILNWGLSLVFGGLLARAIARRTDLRVDYRALGAAAFWGSAPCGRWACPPRPRSCRPPPRRCRRSC